MRRNFFLHFLNRDTREIQRVYDQLDRGNHARAIRAPLNAAAMLCEDACYAPPGFVIEDEIAFELFELQSAYLQRGLVRLPLRERSLADYAEKKRSEYAPARNRYSGLFDDSRMNYLSSFGASLVRRKVQIGPAIAKGFLTGVDSQKPAWKRIRHGAPAKIIDELRYTPDRLAAEGKALTWSIMQPHFAVEGTPFHADLRDALQHVYFQEYCREFKLIALTDIPYLMEVFYLPVDRRAFSFRRFSEFLRSFHAADLFLGASADFVLAMRQSAGFNELMDAYVSLAEGAETDNDLKYRTAIAVRGSKFDWGALALRRRGTIGDPSNIEMLEIVDACAELAGILTKTYGLPTRLENNRASEGRRVACAEGTASLRITVFVALEEELEVLSKHLSLTRNAAPPAATGHLGKVELDVLCPRKMGRVAAAVAVTQYLARQKPDLILCIGLAGGFREAKIDEGAVICANTVVDLANRKVTDDAAGAASLKFRQEDFACSSVIYSIATSHQFDLEAWEKHCRDHFDWPTGRVPSLREGKIASVDEVLSSDAHRAKMVAHVDKLLGVEMEAGGVCEAARTKAIPVAVLRVVSDMADPSKADNPWRIRGMRSLSELLKRLPLEQVIAAVRSG